MQRQCWGEEPRPPPPARTQHPKVEAPEGQWDSAPPPESTTSTRRPQQAEGSHSGQHFIDPLTLGRIGTGSWDTGLCLVCRP